jgi:hypothetical protein
VTLVLFFLSLCLVDVVGSSDRREKRKRAILKLHNHSLQSLEAKHKTIKQKQERKLIAAHLLGSRQLNQVQMHGLIGTQHLTGCDAKKSRVAEEERKEIRPSPKKKKSSTRARLPNASSSSSDGHTHGGLR